MAISRKAEIQNPKSKIQTRIGFTLIELLVVVAIIGILIGILLPVVTKVKAEGQKAVTRGHIQDLSKAIESYKVDLGEYPEDLPSTGGETFFYYLLAVGSNSPYVDQTKLRVSGAGVPIPTTIKVLDSWGTPLRYFRAPRIGKVDAAKLWRFFPTNTLLNTALGNFRGNKNSYNLWSCGPDYAGGIDESSEEALGDFLQSATMKAGGDVAVGNDIVNWQ